MDQKYGQGAVERVLTGCSSSAIFTTNIKFFFIHGGASSWNKLCLVGLKTNIFIQAFKKCLEGLCCWF